MSVFSHWHRTELHVWRETTVPDGSGGFTVSYADQGALWFKVASSTAQEQLVAAQSGASHSHNIFTEPDNDVKRNDRLAVSGVDPNTARPYYRVVATTTAERPASSEDVYLKCAAERVETG